MERDKGVSQLKRELKIISTHTLTWSVTIVIAVKRFVCGNFNSHAHVERDVIIMKIYEYEIYISTHTLTWSVTLDVVYIWCLLNVMRTYFFI